MMSSAKNFPVDEPRSRGVDNCRAELMMRVWTRMANGMRDLYGIGTDEYPIAEVGERSA